MAVAATVARDGLAAFLCLDLSSDSASALVSSVSIDDVFVIYLARERGNLGIKPGRGLRCHEIAAGALPRQFEVEREAAQAEAADLGEIARSMGFDTTDDDILWAMGILDDVGERRLLQVPESLVPTLGETSRWCVTLPSDGGVLPHEIKASPFRFSNTHLLLRHGFCLPGNPHDRIGPFHLEIEEADPLKDERAQVIAARGIPLEHWLGPAVSGGLPVGLEGLVECLRVLLCQDTPVEVSPVASCPVPHFPDLDVLCLQTVEELLNAVDVQDVSCSDDAGVDDVVQNCFFEPLQLWKREQLQIVKIQHAAVQALLREADDLPAAKRRRLAVPFLREPPQDLTVVRLDCPSRQDLTPYVAMNRPVVLGSVLKSAAWPLKAGFVWTDEHLIRCCGDLSVAARCTSQNRVFGDAFEAGGRETKEIPLREYIAALRNPSPDLYAARVPLKTFPALEAQTCSPDSMLYGSLFGRPYFEGVIMYFGAGSQVTPLHFDEQENLLFVLRGSKTFILYPPSDAEKLYPGAHPRHFFSRVRTAQPDLDLFPKFVEARSVRVEVGEGDGLYLPYAWWHEVHGSAGQNLTLNYWYDVPHSKSELCAERCSVEDPTEPVLAN